MNTFDKVKELIRGHHTKGIYSDGNNYCLVGALRAVINTKVNPHVDSNVYSSNEYKLLQKVILEQYPDRATDADFKVYEPGLVHVPAFNDDDVTTEEDVITVLEKASIIWNEYE